MSNRIGEGRTHYCAAAVAVAHGAPVTQNGFVGTAVKTVAAPAGTGLGDSKITTIAVGEKYHIELKGDRYLTNARQEGGSFAVGDPVYIRTADNLITATSNSGANPKYGRVSEIDDGNGAKIASGSGLMLLNLDAKDGFV